MKTRLFEQHEIREILPLSPTWEFWTLDSMGNEIERYNMIVPCVWESNLRLSSYKGQAMYRKQISFGGNVRLVFKGVSHTATVYLDGVKVGYHYNAYTEFDIVLTGVMFGEHCLEVKVDNTFNEESALHLTNDYYSYGGITRPIEVQLLKDIYINNLQFKPFFVDGQWYGRIRTVITSLSEHSSKVHLNFELGSANYQEAIEFNGKEDKILETTYQFENITPYELNNPFMYELKVTLEKENDIIDDLIDRIGFREIAVKGTDILFNGKKVIIKGVNRHEDYAEFGCALPVEAMYRDIEIIKSLGANCIRTCHYPNDERFLDMCDENGILVWEEAHARGLNEAQMKHKNFNQQSADCIREMIEHHYNHPSIYVWGVLNECVSNTEFGHSIYKLQIDQIKALDDSRPVTYAALQAFIGNDLSLDLVDIVSYNIYPRWYENVGTVELVQKLKDFVQNSDGKNKPLLISEIGAGGIYGHRSNNCEKWTEEYQELLLEEHLTTVLEDKDLSGVIIWQYADCRVDPGWFGGRPKSQNNKGLVDIYRREKLAFRKVKEIYNRL